MFDGLFIVSIIGTFVQAIKEGIEPTVLPEKPIYPEPHRDPVSGKIMIENCKLYNEDVKKYGAWQSQQWVKQGKYNLSGEELEKEKERIKSEYQKLYHH